MPKQFEQFEFEHIVGKLWELSFKIVHLLYTKVVMPIITYACLSWWYKPGGGCVKGLNKLQWLVCLAIPGGLFITPITH